MSLINEALRKARREPENANRPEFATSAHDMGRMGTSRILLTGGLIAILAAAAGAGGLWFVLSRENPSPAIESATVLEEPSQLPVLGEESRTETPAIENEGEDPATLQHRDTETAFPTPAGENSPDPDPTPSSAPASATTPPVSTTTSRDQEFVAEANIGNTRLVLDYIVYRNEDPWAQINGLEVHVGQRVEGFRVDEINRNTIRLSTENHQILLKAR